MFISKIKIKGFRNFKETEIEFNDGINVIIGHNNGGKTNLLKALSLVLDYQGSKRLDVDDFNKVVDINELKKTSPVIEISTWISESKNESLYGDDLVTVSNWLTRLNSPYEARLTYIFFLPEKEHDNYEKALAGITEVDEVFRVIKKDFIRKYSYKIFGGDPSLQTTADGENLQKFDFQFLDAIRDVERDMFTGRSTLLREVLHFFMDYEIKRDSSKTPAEQDEAIRKRQQEFQDKAKPVMQEFFKRIQEGEKEILDYATKTGASFNNAKPAFDGGISDVELITTLRLIVESQTGIKVPATHNGLGYNNLIYMSLLLAKMQVNADGNYYGSNAKVFPILSIEEPEAHLHPSMQFKFLKFLKDNKKSKVRQVFVTTHSTHITSAVSLDEVICLHNENGLANVAYPGKVFGEDESGKKSKAYVERFLDATKSNILFAQKVILVEGIAEQILIPTFAKYLGDDKHLENHHVAVVSVGGRYFDHFLKLFDSTKPNTVHKRIACITDRDPERKDKSKGGYQKCYPFEYKTDQITFDYKENASDKIASYQTHPNIRFFSQSEEKGKTFEYKLAFQNPTLEILVTESISNGEEVKELIKAYREGKPLAEFTLRKSDENDRILQSINSPSCTWTEDDKKKAVIAARYLNSVGKGENALELATKLEEDLSSGNPQFIVPNYLKEAIEWLLQ